MELSHVLALAGLVLGTVAVLCGLFFKVGQVDRSVKDIKEDVVEIKEQCRLDSKAIVRIETKLNGGSC